MTTPSQTPEAAGLEVVAWRWPSAFVAGAKACSTMKPKALGRDVDLEPLVTAASAQAAIDAEKARADRLEKFGQHINWELSFCYLDDEEGEPGCWAVHSVNGGRNDREWTLIGRGDTPDDAIRAALQQETQP